MATRGTTIVTALVWRRPRGVASSFELLLTHPGAPLFEGRDDGAWFFPSETHTDDSRREDDLVETALRGLFDTTGLLVETPAVALGSTLDDGHTLIAFAFEADGEPPRSFQSPQGRMEWPPHSGHEIAFALVDAMAFIDAETALKRVHPSQRVFVERLADVLKG